MAHPFESLRCDEVQSLTGDGLDDSVHQWSQPEIDACTLAMAARRPLLVRGEPGTGKTQLARAVAQHLGWRLHAITVNSRTEPQDLLYRFDAVRRLADAQAPRRPVDDEPPKGLAESEYWEPGPLWRAYGWASACEYGSCRMLVGTEPAGHVILLDEIDKADSDLPNSLLEILGQRSHSFTADQPITIGGPDAPQPLVVVTTNEERELPAAFLRRCIVLNLQPEPGTSYEDWLVSRGSAHFGATEGRAELLGEPLLRQAARQLCADRGHAIAASLPPPGAAEYLDLLQALHGLAPGDPERQAALLQQLSRYAFVKHVSDADTPQLSQRRAPLTDAPADAG